MDKEKLNNIVCESSSDYAVLNTAYNYIENLEQQCKKQKEINKKAIEYIKNKGGYCEEYKMTSTPFNTIELDNLLQILEDKEV